MFHNGSLMVAESLFTHCFAWIKSVVMWAVDESVSQLNERLCKSAQWTLVFILCVFF